MGTIVTKFGGSSLADAAQFEKVKEILLADAVRKYVVPSAPGKRSSEDEKVTDLLYLLQRMAVQGENINELFGHIVRRYEGIIAGLGIDLDLSTDFAAIRSRIISGANADYAASRGEYLNGKILAAYLGWHFVDAFDVIFFRPDGGLDEERTAKTARQVLQAAPYSVIPGFYGQWQGQVKTFSRGGSDVTGAIVAAALDADVYENWTDVSGFLMADPRIIKDPLSISEITYRELRELSYMGATVLHEEAVFPVHKKGVPINIKNTNQPEHPGTRIVPKREESRKGSITGIAGHKGFTVIAIEKSMMNNELGFGQRVLGVLAQNGVSFEHLPTGIDTMSVIVSDKQLNGKLDQVLEGIRRACHPDSIDIHHGLALIATVGQGMIQTPGVAAKVFHALYQAGVSIRMIDQGSSELNIIVGVEEQDFNTAVKAIYDAFVA